MKIPALALLATLSLVSCATHAPSARRPAADMSDAAYEKAVQTAEALREAYNRFRMEKLDGKPATRTEAALQSALTAYRQAMAQGTIDAMGPAWTRESFRIGGETVEIATLHHKLISLGSGTLEVKDSDLALNPVPTSDNELEVLAGREKFWPRLMEDIRNAKESIHIHIFGMQWDEWGKEFAEAVEKKVREDKVKVRIIADMIGARMQRGIGFGGKIGGLHPPGEKMFQFYEKAGVEYAFYKSRLIRDKGIHVDHRKYFIIDGKVAYNTGFTLEEHMRRIEFDIAVRAQGSVVRQMQASWLLNWAKLGKKLDTQGVDALVAKYLPEPAVKGAATVSMALNVPWQQHRVTEDQSDAIRGAKRRIWIIDPYPIDKPFTRLLLAARERGVEVRVVTPSIPENDVNSKLWDAINFAMRAIGVDTRVYQAPDKLGKTHAKGIIVDDWASVGSCNRDTMALRHNFEQNLQSSDPSFVRQVEKEVFEHVFEHSVPHEVPVDRRKKLTIKAFEKLRGGLGLLGFDPT
jgi:cardiolipin synthase A/B